MTNKSSNFFQPGRNCWRNNHLNNAAMLIDCANFYRAIHDAIGKAQHSIFILGWEIDSGIQLLHGEEARQAKLPSLVLDLLAAKASENPQLQIYLLRWDSSVVFLGDRELAPEFVWTAQTPENLQIYLDDTIPMGGSHHQKIILIDDELVFTGGMDIARQRWDERDHRPIEPERKDANGPYGPYHDVQIVLDGPVVKDFAELVRWRWENAAGYPALPYRKGMAQSTNKIVPSWPEAFPPFFHDMTCAIARTLPQMDKNQEAHEVKQMYLDLISQAEDFIYMENQFFTQLEIAEALNRRLKEKPRLRIILVSSYNPQGIFERESMWAGRIDFKKTLEDGIDKNRVRMVCSGILGPDGKTYYKRIHSKITVVDQDFLCVASSNINQRSMSMDTECDIVLQARNQEQAANIAFVRNDLLAEHTGRHPHEVADLIEHHASLDTLLGDQSSRNYRLYEIDDSQFTTKSLQNVVTPLADPTEPLIGGSQMVLKSTFRNPRKHKLLVALVVLIFIGGLIFFIREHLNWFTSERIQSFLESSRSSPWAFPMVLGVYIVGGFILFPVTVTSLITAAVFGVIWGPIYGLSGALTSAALMFVIGRWVGLKGARPLIGDRIRSLDRQFQKTGILGVTALRLIPIAPFTLVNLAAGISSVSFFDFIAGSFLGFLPAFVAKGIVGDSIVQVFLNPTDNTLIYLGVGLVLWIAMVVASYLLAKRWQKRQAST